MAAIYQWFQEIEVVLTTPPYPVEVDNSLQLSMDLTGFWDWEVVQDLGEQTFSFNGGERLDVLITLPPEYDYSESTFGFIGGERLDVLLALPPEYDYSESTFGFIGGERIDYLIYAYSPPQNLVMSMDIDPDSFEMILL